MESKRIVTEKGWAVWSPRTFRIFYDSFRNEKELSENAFRLSAMEIKSGYKAIPVTISYEKPHE